MKSKILLTVFLLINLIIAREFDYLNSADYTVLENESYNKFELTKFDIVMPKSVTPTPLVIYIHGGGFTHGDKSAGLKRENDVLYYLKNNIAFATINYRFYNQNDSVGVQKCLDDVQAAIQYIRFYEDKYNIDKERIACYGISAGAGSSMYLAFHDDMAIPNDTTALGESTRILCAGALETQATYDILRWRKFIPGLRLVLMIKGKVFYKSIANFYGYPTYQAFKPEQKRVAAGLDLLEMITPDDPPIYVMNMQKERFPKDNNTIQHHRGHALVLDKILKRQNIEHYVFIRDRKHKSKEDVDYKIRTFLVEHLLEN